MRTRRFGISMMSNVESSMNALLGACL